MVPLERLTGRIAHDFNNLLSVILSSVDWLMAERDLDDRHVAPLRDIEHAARRGAELVAQLTAYGRQQLLLPMVIDLNDAIAQLAEEIHRTLGDQVRVQFRLGGEPACARLDPAQLRRVVLNLVENARDAMPAGGTLTIDVEPLELHGFGHADLGGDAVPCVMLAVTDTGVGMNEYVRAHAFEPFFTTKKAGTGMGLASVRGIVSQSGGALWLDSSPGEGTTIAAYFPRVAAANSSPSQFEAADGNATKNAMTGRILLVDDEPAVRRTLARILERAGFVVLQAGSPSEALKIAADSAKQIDLVLTDVVMPEMSGMDLVDRLRRSTPDLQVLYTSGHPAEALTDLEEAQRCQPFMQKPVDQSKLLATIRAMLARQAIPRVQQ